jgi:hypothetical protein
MGVRELNERLMTSKEKEVHGFLPADQEAIFRGIVLPVAKDYPLRVLYVKEGDSVKL